MLVFVVLNIAQAMPYLDKPFNVSQQSFDDIFGSAKVRESIIYIHCSMYIMIYKYIYMFRYLLILLYMTYLFTHTHTYICIYIYLLYIYNIVY